MATARPAVVGGFVLGALALAVAGTLFFGGTQLFEPTVRAIIFFEGSVAGLDVGAPVTFRGVRVGSVEQITIHLSISGQSSIPVIVELEPKQVVVEQGVQREGAAGLKKLVDAGLRAQLKLQSFVTGQFEIDLDFRPGTPIKHVIENTSGLPEIPTIPSDIERLRTTLQEVPIQQVMQSTQRLLDKVDHLVGRLDTGLGPLLDSARRSTDSLSSILETTRQAVVSLQGDASHTLQQLDGLVAETRGQIGDRGGELARLLGSVDRASRQAESLLASVGSLTAPRSQFRSDIEAAARDLAASADSLRGFSREVERDPSTVLRGRSAR